MLPRLVISHWNSLYFAVFISFANIEAACGDFLADDVVDDCKPYDSDDSVVIPEPFCNVMVFIGLLADPVTSDLILEPFALCKVFIFSGLLDKTVAGDFMAGDEAVNSILDAL